MPRYQTASQRASGANSASSGAMNGCVSDRSSKERAFSRRPGGYASAAATASTQTSARLTTSASSASRSAALRAASRRGRAIASRTVMVVASFWTENENVITAVVTVALALVLAQLVDRAISRRGGRLAQAMPGELSPVASTRLRLVRRLVYAGIIVIGIALALSQFAAGKRGAPRVRAAG